MTEVITGNEPSVPPDSKHLFYPPGGLLLWALVLMELLTFCVALITFFVSSKSAPEVFHASRMQLVPLYGLTNTVFLLTSGYFMALSLQHFKQTNLPSARRFLSLTMLGGLLFLILKGVEYQQKISQGFTLDYDTFFTYYWLLTVFHLMHVLVGMVILICLFFRLKSPKKLKMEDYAAGATFWHMCDLIWLILFPALYLIV
jgi:nitric oxide reductase NorE protein